MKDKTKGIIVCSIAGLIGAIGCVISIYLLKNYLIRFLMLLFLVIIPPSITSSAVSTYLNGNRRLGILISLVPVFLLLFALTIGNSI